MRWLLDSHGVIVHVSREWQLFTGLTDREVLGAASCPSVHIDDRKAVDHIIRSAVARRSSYLAVFRSCRPDNTYSWVTCGATPSFSPATGECLGYLGETGLLKDTPEPPWAADILHRIPRSRHQVVMLDNIADHIITARNIAKHIDDLSVAKILDRALLTIGEQLYRLV